jgi:predicted flap endonuclease-1-like 5' DNA nuclease
MNIEKIEGIGEKYAEKLKAAGIKSTEQLLESAGSRKGRQMLAEKTGITETLILEWVNLADLFRVPGIGEEYSDLLEEAGVDTVKELRNRNAENLHKALQEVNARKHLVRQLPGFNQVESWIKAAKELEAKVTY